MEKKHLDEMENMLVSDMKEVASATGIEIETLNSLSNQAKLDISVAFAYDNKDIRQIYDIVNDDLNNNTLSEVAEFMHTTIEKLKEFNSEVQNHLVGMFAMEHDITADEELRNNLFAIIGEGVIC